MSRSSRKSARTAIIRAVTSWPKREQVDPADLIGAGEILKLVGWKTRKSLLDAQKTRDFPSPVVVVRGARLWHREDVERWVKLYKSEPV
jgi:predicted DNA-binding transcriptional regulator AlpA